MRHVFAVKPGLSAAQWEVLLRPILAWKAAHHFVLTQEVRACRADVSGCEGSYREAIYQ